MMWNCGSSPIGFVVLFNALITLRSYWYNDFKSNWPVISYPSPLIPAVFSFGLGSGFARLYSLLYEGTRNPAPRKFFCWSFSTRGAWPEGCTIPLQERPLLSSDVRHVLYVFRCGYICSIMITQAQCQFVYSYFEKGYRKKCTRQSRKVLWVVCFEFTSSSTIFEKMARERPWTYLC